MLRVRKIPVYWHVPVFIKSQLSKASYQKPVTKSQLSKASYQKPVIKSKFLLSVHAQNLALLPDPPSNFCVPVESQTCLNVYCLYVVTSSSHGWYDSDPLQVTLCQSALSHNSGEPNRFIPRGGWTGSHEQLWSHRDCIFASLVTDWIGRRSLVDLPIQWLDW